MLYNVSSLLKEHSGATREIDIDDDLSLDGTVVHLTGHARLDRTPRGILVRATAHGAHVDQCSRCLRPTSTPIDIVIEEEFIPRIDMDTGARIEILEGEDEAYRLTPRHELDLREPLAQYWSMTVPMAAVCGDDCPGLCPNCGQPSAPDHACADAPIDERWAKLSRLKST